VRSRGGCELNRTELLAQVRKDQPAATPTCAEDVAIMQGSANIRVCMNGCLCSAVMTNMQRNREKRNSLQKEGCTASLLPAGDAVL
jgi:hypothetical protein